MNKGVIKANGEWIYFLGADDTFYDNKVLEKIFTLNHNSNFIYGDVFSLGLNKIYGGEFTLDRLLFRNMSHQAVFYRREVFDMVGSYNLRYRLFADWDFHLRCFANPNVKQNHIDVTIANFGADGVSSQSEDVLFLEEVIVPLNLKHLQDNGTIKLRNIKTYDAWWRLLRAINKRNDFEFSKQFNTTETVILRMVRNQSFFSSRQLQNGYVSKSLMFWSYKKALLHRDFKTNNSN